VKLLHADPETLPLIPDDELPPPRLRTNVAIARGTVMIPIPPGTRQFQCSCGAFVYWGIHPSTKRPHVVSMRHVHAVHPTSTTFGEGITHFADCEHADRHRRLR
jgi:hypothetical protein